MNTYISMLRGINVSGQRLIKMEALRQMYTDMGFSQVKTYIQSGNVIFHTSDTDVKSLEILISSQILETFGHTVTVIVLKPQTLQKIIEANPFAISPSHIITDLYVTFLASAPQNADIQKIRSKITDQEDLWITDEVVYLNLPHGSGKTKLSNNFLESHLKVNATTRNWKSTLELLRLATL